MLKHWYVYIIIGILAEVLLEISKKYKLLKFIRWEPLRFFIVLFIASIICWGIYDLIV